MRGWPVMLLVPCYDLLPRKVDPLPSVPYASRHLFLGYMSQRGRELVEVLPPLSSTLSPTPLPQPCIPTPHLNHFSYHFDAILDR